MTKVPLSAIETPGLRIPGTDEDLEVIAKSLQKHGQFFPVRLREHPSKTKRYEVIFGNRRIAAAKKLGWEDISAEIVQATDEQALAMAFSENLDRKDFSDYEKALLLQKLRSLTGKTIEDIASLVCRSPSYVSQHIAMLGLFPEGLDEPDKLADLLQLLSERHARALAKIDNPAERLSTAKFAVKANLGVRELEKICNSAIKGKVHLTAQRNKSEIRNIIYNIIEGLNSKDLSQFFGPISKRYFTMFSRFPPFDKMEMEEAMDYLSNVLKQMSSYRVKIEDLDVKIFQNFAYATFYELHRIGIGTKVTRTKTRATIIFAKEDGLWKILHEHWSSANPSEFMGWLYEKGNLEASELRVNRVQDHLIR